LRCFSILGQNGRSPFPRRARMLIRPRPPFDFRHTLRFNLGPPAPSSGQEFRPLLDHFEDGEYRRVVDLDGEPVLYGVREESGGLGVRILRGPSSPAAQAVVQDVVMRQFSPDLDLRRFYRQVASDPVLSRLTRHFRGLRIPQSPNVFATVVSAILDQQVNLAFAFKVKKALVETYGDHVIYEGRRYSAFPTPAALAILTPRELRKIQISGPKARYIIALACDVLDGRLDLERLRDEEPGRAYARLLEQKGIGPWTAFFVGLVALAHPDALPSADVGLQSAIHTFYRLRRRPTPARVERLARSWTGWRSYATFYLWMTYWQTPEWRQEFIRELAGVENAGKRFRAQG
jgi:DNA-3-methyladenine glycosylase II